MIRYLDRYNKHPLFLSLQLLLLFVLSNAIFGRVGWKLDLSQSQRFALTESTKKVLGNLSETLYINAYYSQNIPGEYQPPLQLTQEMIREIASVNSDQVVLRFFNPDSDPQLQEKAKEAGIEPQTLERVERGGAEVKEAYLGLELRIGEKTEIIPIAYSASDVEYQILSAVKKLNRKGDSSGIAVAEMDGSLGIQRPGRGSGKDTMGVFIHQGIEPELGSVESLDLNENRVPDEIITLLIAGNPTWTELGLWHLDQFLMRGGNLVYLAKTIDFSMANSNSRMAMLMGGGMGAGVAREIPQSDEFHEFTKHYGFEVESNLVFDTVASLPMGPIVQVKPGQLGRYHYPYWFVAEKSDSSLNEKNPFSSGISNLVLPWSSSIDFNEKAQKEAQFIPLVETTENSGTKENMVQLAEDKVYKQGLNPSGGPYTLALSIEGRFHSYFSSRSQPKQSRGGKFLSHTEDGKKSRILVFGTPYLVSDLLAQPEFRSVFLDANVPFAFNALDILSGETDLLAARGKKSVIEKLDPVPQAVQYLLNTINVLIFPLAIGIYGFLRYRRRMKQR